MVAPTSVLARDLTATYPGAPRPALAGVDFAAGPGVHAVVGPTGAGKTTLLRVLAGQLPPAGGRAVVGGRNVGLRPLAARAGVGYVPQEVGLPHELSLAEYLDELLALDGERGREARAGLARQAAAAVHLDGALDRRLRHFSGGMRRRALLAQALARRPSVLLADEPSAGLDPEEQLTVRDLLRDLGLRCCVVLATHFLDEAEALGGRVTILREGRVLRSGSVPQLLAAARGMVWMVGADAEPGPGRVLQRTVEPGSRRLLGSPPAGTPARPAPPTIEDAYLLALLGQLPGDAA